MRQVVHLKLRVVPVFGEPAAADHDPRVQHEHVEPVVLGEEGGRERPDRRERREVERHDLRVAPSAACAELLARGLALGGVAHREHDARAHVRERDRRLLPDSGVRAGDDDRLSRHVVHRGPLTRRRLRGL